MTSKQGIIEKEIGAIIEPHEALAADVLAMNGFNVLFIKPRNTYKTKTPDIVMSGLEWEIKSPTSSDRNTIRNILHKATKQSNNLIIDTIRTNMQDDEVVKCVER